MKIADGFFFYKKPVRKYFLRVFYVHTGATFLSEVWKCAITMVDLFLRRTLTESGGSRHEHD